MGQAENTITLPLEVDPTPAVEALKSFLSIVAEVGSQSQKLLSGEMLAPNFGSIDAEVSRLTEALRQYSVEQHNFVEESGAVGQSHEAQAAAAGQEAEANLTLRDTIRSSRQEHRMGMFAIMGVTQAVEGLTGRSTTLTRVISQSAGSAFGMKFAMDAMGLSMWGLPVAIAVAALSGLRGAFEGNKQAAEEENKALKEQREEMEQNIQKARELKAQLDKSFPSSASTTKTLDEYYQTLKKMHDEVERQMSESTDKNQYLLGELTPYGKLMAQEADLRDQMTATNKALIDRAALVKFIMQLAADGKQANINKLLGTMTPEETSILLQGLKDAQNQVAKNTDYYKEYGKAIDAVNASIAKASARTGAKGGGSDPDAWRAERRAFYEKEATDAYMKEQRDYVEGEKAAAKERERLELEEAEQRRRDFEESWGYAEQLGQILQEAFNKGDTGAQKMIQYLQIALQIAKQISAMSSGSGGSSSSSSDSSGTSLGSILNLLGSVASLAALADEGAVVEGPNFVRVGPGVREAFLPIKDLPGLLPSINASVYGTADNAGLIAEVRGLREAITHMAPPEVHMHGEVSDEWFRRRVIQNNRNERFRKPT